MDAVSAGYEFDVDSWAKEDCACNHRRYRHASGGGACSGTRQRQVLPEGIDPNPPESDDLFAWPEAWPPLSEWPVVTEPCGCKHFYEPEQSEPDWDER